MTRSVIWRTNALLLAVLGGSASFSLAQPVEQLDHDGDGIADHIVLQPASSPLGDGVGGEDPVVEIVSGATGQPIVVLPAPIPVPVPGQTSLFGFSATPFGDLNNDGVADVLVTDPSAYAGTNNPGRAYVLSGVNGAALRTFAPIPGEIMTWVAAPTLDQDGDGVRDVIVVTLRPATQRGLAERFTIFSGATGKVLGNAARADRWWPKLAIRSVSAGIVQPPPDVNGDGAVNQDDAVEIAEQIGTVVVPGTAADFAVNGVIDFEDLDAFDAVVAAANEELRQVVRRLPRYASIASTDTPVDDRPLWYDGAIASQWQAVVSTVPGLRLRVVEDGPGMNAIRTGTGGAGTGALPCQVLTELPRCWNNSLWIHQNPFGEVYPQRTMVLHAELEHPQNVTRVEWQIVSGAARVSPQGLSDSNLTLTLLALPNYGAVEVKVCVWFSDGCTLTRRTTFSVSPCPGAALEGPAELEFWQTGTLSLRDLGAGVATNVTFTKLTGGGLITDLVPAVINSMPSVHYAALTRVGQYAIRCQYGPASDPCRGVSIFYGEVIGGQQDSDGDGWSDFCEGNFGSDPFNPNDPPAALANVDSDHDGLTNMQEACARTNPNDPDTDHDGLPDGMEVSLGLNPNSGDSDSNGTPDGDEDYDGDGLSNHDEIVYGSNPTNSDSDGDGTNDGAEAGQGSDPNDRSDNGQAPPEDQLSTVQLTIGDQSSSESEIWALDVGPISLRAPGYGRVISRAFKFRQGAHEIRVRHLGTKLGSPDFDYTARVEVIEGSLVGRVDDPQGLLGVFMCGGHNCAEGKTATLIIGGILEPDPETHLRNRSLMILPGDTEHALPVAGGTLPSDLVIRVENQSVARLLLNGQPVESLSGSQVSSEGVEVQGIKPGRTVLTIKSSASAARNLQNLEVIVGGAIRVEYDHAPLFYPLGNEVGSAPSNEIEDGLGGLPFASHPSDVVNPETGRPLARQRVAEAVRAVVPRATYAEQTATVRVRVFDARGDRKPSKRVAIHSLDQLIVYDSLGDRGASTGAKGTPQEGWVDIRVRTDPEQIPAHIGQATIGLETGVIPNDLSVIVGRGAEEFEDNPEVLAGIIDFTRDEQKPQTHTFTGHSLEFDFTTTSISTWSENNRTITTVPMPAINELHYQIFKNHFQEPVYNREYLFPDTGPVTLMCGDEADVDTNGDGILDSAECVFAPNGSRAKYLFSGDEELSLTALQWFRYSMLDGFNAAHPDMTFAWDVRWREENNEVPVGEQNSHLLANLASALTEFALGFVPGFDLVFAVRDGFVYPVFYDEATAANYISATVSIAGVAADFGYLAGPLGVLGNACTGAMRFVVKWTPEPVLKAMLKMSAKTMDSLELLYKYMSKYKSRFGPPESIEDAVEWGYELSVKMITQWDAILRSPIGLTAEHLAGATKAFARRMTARTASRAATEGGAAIVKEFAEHGVTKFDEFAEAITRNIPNPEHAGEALDDVTATLDRSIRDAFPTSGIPPDSNGMRRARDAVEAAARGLDSRYRTLVTAEIGPGKAFRSMEEFEAVRFMRAENVLPSQKDAIKRIVGNIPPLSAEPVAKVMSVADFNRYVDEGFDTVSGSIARRADIEDVIGANKASVNDALRLDYSGSNFPDGSGYAVLDIEAPGVDIVGNARVPKSAGYYEGGLDRFVEGERAQYPFTGNGLIASKDGKLRPEYDLGGPDRGPFEAPRRQLPLGSKLKRYNEAGQLEATKVLVEKEVDGVLKRVWE